MATTEQLLVIPVLTYFNLLIFLPPLPLTYSRTMSFHFMRGWHLRQVPHVSHSYISYSSSHLIFSYSFYMSNHLKMMPLTPLTNPHFIPCSLLEIQNLSNTLSPSIFLTPQPFLNKLTSITGDFCLSFHTRLTFIIFCDHWYDYSIKYLL